MKSEIEIREEQELKDFCSFGIFLAGVVILLFLVIKLLT